VKQRTALRLGWGLVALFAGLSTLALGLQILAGGWSQVLEDLLFVPFFLGFGIVGALIASAQPRNAVGWILLGVTVAVAVAFFSDEYARYSFEVRSHPLPGALWTAWFSSWGWLGFIAPTLTFLPLLFPDGRLPTPRWRAFAWFTGAEIASWPGAGTTVTGRIPEVVG
jgi:hypothetical protein